MLARPRWGPSFFPPFRPQRGFWVIVVIVFEFFEFFVCCFLWRDHFSIFVLFPFLHLLSSSLSLPLSSPNSGTLQRQHPPHRITCPPFEKNLLRSPARVSSTSRFFEVRISFFLFFFFTFFLQLVCGPLLILGGRGVVAHTHKIRRLRKEERGRKMKEKEKEKEKKWQRSRLEMEFALSPILFLLSPESFPFLFSLFLFVPFPLPLSF